MMKKILGLCILCMTFALTSCEQPEAPASIIGHWRVIGDHWTATFEEDGELTISSSKYDCFYPHHYTATNDSLYITSGLPYTVDGQEVKGDVYVCTYSFKGSPTLVIDGFNQLFQGHGSTADKIKKKNPVVFTRRLR